MAVLTGTQTSTTKHSLGLALGTPQLLPALPVTHITLASGAGVDLALPSDATNTGAGATIGSGGKPKGVSPTAVHLFGMAVE